ncbi:heme-binding protein, partial [Streptomyces noursei]
MQMPSTRTRIIAGAAVLAAVGVTAVGAVAVAAPDNAARSGAATAVQAQNVVATDHLTVAAATKAAQAALAAAEKADQHVSVAVVDRNGNTLVTLRGDGAGPQSYKAAEEKAFTAVSWNAPITVEGTVTNHGTRAFNAIDWRSNETELKSRSS